MSGTGAGGQAHPQPPIAPIVTLGPTTPKPDKSRGGYRWTSPALFVAAGADGRDECNGVRPELRPGAQEASMSAIMAENRTFAEIEIGETATTSHGLTQSELEGFAPA